jgi:hypothetical protein
MTPAYSQALKKGFAVCHSLGAFAAFIDATFAYDGI